MTHERRVLVLAFWAGLPGALVSLSILWFGDYSLKVQWTLTLFIVGIWLGCALAVRSRVTFTLQTLANLLEATREGDYSLRGRHAVPDDALGQVMLEINTLSSTLRRQRFEAVEATGLMRTVIAEVDLAVFAFDDLGRLQLVNRAGEKVLARPAESLLGRRAESLGLEQFLRGPIQHTVQRTFPGGVGRWGVRRSQFRLDGRDHTLLVLTDLSRTLREEERQAWQRLIRVLGHELNNSLTPIKSMSSTLQMLAERKPEDWEEDLTGGLRLIGERAEALSRFIRAYSRLARLPQPKRRPLDVGPWLERLSNLGPEFDSPVQLSLEPGPPVTVQADADQLEQLLINLLRNAADAVAEAGGRGGVQLGWLCLGDPREAGQLEIHVIDDGPGLANIDNLFVPFFTTKPQGTGIGLVLCRQIAEAHGGTLTLENRQDTRGCIARLRLPL